MNQRVRYTVSDVTNNRFYQMPKFLFDGEFKSGLCNDAKVLYSLLRDRHDLSLSNNWINDSGEVYLIYARDKMADMVGVSQPTLRKAIEQLKEFGLMEEERMGLNKPNRIYLTAVTVDIAGVKESFIPECKNLSLKNDNNFHSKAKESFNLNCKDLSRNDTDINDTDINDTDINDTDINDTDIINQSILQASKKSNTDRLIEKYSMEYIKGMLETEAYKTDLQDNLYEELTNLVYDVVNETKDTIKINGSVLSTEVVRSRFLKLNPGNILYVIAVIKKQTTKIHNIRQYLITALYNSFSSIDSYYTNTVNHDLYGA
jgi:DNA-binding Lrp family transcriptional regulator